MNKNLMIILPILTILSVVHKVKGQALLSPQELIGIQRFNDSSAVSDLLNIRGYVAKSGEHYGLKSTNWYFQSQPGEYIDYLVVKVILPNGKPQLIYNISNAYNYREFMNKLIAAEFKFTEIQIIDKKCFSVFKKDKESFLILNTASDQLGFEIIIN